MDYLLSNWYSIIVLAINIGLVITIIFVERKNPTSVWSWVLLLALFPIFGFILYLLLGRRLRKKHLFRWNGRKDIGIEQLLSEQKSLVKNETMDYKDETNHLHKKLIYMQLTNNHAIFTQNNEVNIYTEGTPKFEALLLDISRAQHHIHMQYYIFRDDELGMRLVQALMQKAREGVEVRFLYDAIGSKSFKKRTMKKMREAGVDTETFFPSIFPMINPRLNYRNHRKIVIIDGEVGYIGGFNVGNEYLGKVEKYGYWRDTHIRVIGDSVFSLQSRFFLDWNAAKKAQALDYSDDYFPESGAQGDIGIQIVSSGPDNQWEAVKNGYMKMMISAKRYVYIQTPYFVPDDAIMEAVRLASLSGVDVRIMIPAVPDHKIVYYATMSYVADLLAVGARVFLYDKGFLHAKTVVADDEVCTVGTTNFDVRSFKLNFEVNAFIYNEDTSIAMREIFERDLLDSTELTKAQYEARGFGKKFGESLARLISPIL